MNLDFKTIVIAGLFAFMAFYVTKCNSDKQTEELRAELHKNEIKMDTLKKISDTQYEKLVADTVTKRDMINILKAMEMNIKNPKIITRIEYKQKDVEKTMDHVNIQNDSVHIEDYYPSKEKQTLKYTGDISLVSKKGKGKFQFQPQKLDLVVSEIKEKEPYTDNHMGEHASTGTYYFKKGSYIKKYFQQAIDLDIAS